MIQLSGKLTQAAFSKAQEHAGGKSAGASSGKQVSFEERMSQALGKVSNSSDASQVMKVLSGEIGLAPNKEVTAIASESMNNMPVSSEGQPVEMGQRVADILGEVNDGQVKLQRLIELVTSGTTMSPQELIAVQAGVFSLVQEMELVGKATQEATQGVRQTLNTNVG